MTPKSRKSRIRNFKIFRLRGIIPFLKYGIPDDVIRVMDEYDYVNLMNGLNELDIALDKVKKRRKHKGTK